MNGVSLFFLFLQLSAFWLSMTCSLGIKLHRTYHFRHSFGQGPIALRVGSEAMDSLGHYRMPEAGRPSLLQYLEATKRILLPYEQFYADIAQLFPFESSGLRADMMQLLSSTLKSVNPSFLPVDFRVCQKDASSFSLSGQGIFISVGLLRVYELLHTRIGADGKILPKHAHELPYVSRTWQEFKALYPQCYRANSFPGFPSLGKLRSEWLYRLNFKTLTASIKASSELSPPPPGLVSPSPLAAMLCSMALPNPFSGSSLENLLHRVVADPEGWEYRDGDLVILGVGDTPLLRIKWASRHQEGYNDALVYKIADALGYGEFYSNTIEFLPSPAIASGYSTEPMNDCIGLLSEYISLFPPSIPTPAALSYRIDRGPVPSRALAFAHILSRSGFGNTWNALAYVMGLTPADELYYSCGYDSNAHDDKFYSSDNYYSLPSVDELDLVTDYYHRIPRQAFEALLITGTLMRGYDNHDGNFVLTYQQASDAFIFTNIDYDKYFCNYYPNPIMNSYVAPGHVYTIPMHPHANLALQNLTETIGRLGQVNASHIVRLAQNFVLSRKMIDPGALSSKSTDLTPWSFLYRPHNSKLLFIAEHFDLFLAVMMTQLHAVAALPSQASLLQLDLIFHREMKIDNMEILNHAVPPVGRCALLLVVSFCSASLLRLLYRSILPRMLPLLLTASTMLFYFCALVYSFAAQLCLCSARMCPICASIVKAILGFLICPLVLVRRGLAGHPPQDQHQPDHNGKMD